MGPDMGATVVTGQAVGDRGFLVVVEGYTPLAKEYARKLIRQYAKDIEKRANKGSEEGKGYYWELTTDAGYEAWQLSGPNAGKGMWSGVKGTFWDVFVGELTGEKPVGEAGIAGGGGMIMPTAAASGVNVVLDPDTKAPMTGYTGFQIPLRLVIKGKK